jgi:CBS domain-containing protein
VSRAIEDVMTKAPLFTVPVGTTLDGRAKSARHKVEKLLVVDRDFRLGIDHGQGHPESRVSAACKDALGRLAVARPSGSAMIRSNAPRRWWRPRDAS